MLQRFMLLLIFLYQLNSKHFLQLFGLPLPATEPPILRSSCPVPCCWASTRQAAPHLRHPFGVPHSPLVLPPSSLRLHTGPPESPRSSSPHFLSCAFLHLPGVVDTTCRRVTTRNSEQKIAEVGHPLLRETSSRQAGSSAAGFRAR